MNGKKDYKKDSENGVSISWIRGGGSGDGGHSPPIFFKILCMIYGIDFNFFNFTNHSKVSV
jgi:hypothetical protein